MASQSNAQWFDPKRRKGWRFREAVVALGLVAVVNCSRISRQDTETFPGIQFGVFFGSQIQEREEVALERDINRQQLGFRILFPERLRENKAIEWELDIPTKAVAKRGNGRAARLVRRAQGTAMRDATVFEQRLAILPTDEIGTWNIRVMVEGRTVLDRPFRVVQ